MQLQSCDNHGGDVIVVYKAYTCPLCDTEEKLRDMEEDAGKDEEGYIEEIKALEKQVEDLTEEVRVLKSEQGGQE